MFSSLTSSINSSGIQSGTLVQCDLILQLDCSGFAVNPILFKTGECQESDQGQVSNHISFFRFTVFI